MHKSSAVFDEQKLNNINAEYMRKMQDSEIVDQLKSRKIFENQEQEFLTKLVKVYRRRAQKFDDFKIFSTYLFKLPDYKNELSIFKKSDKQKTQKGLDLVIENLEKLSENSWNDKNNEFVGKSIFNKILTNTVENNKLSNGDVFWPVRVALSGQEKSPSPRELLWILGKEKSIKRIKQAINKLK